MVKRNLFIVAIIIFSLSVANIAFEQELDGPLRKSPSKINATKKPKTTVSQKRTSLLKQSGVKRKPAESKSFYAMINGQSGGKGKQPRKKSTGKRMHKQTK